MADQNDRNENDDGAEETPRRAPAKPSAPASSSLEDFSKFLHSFDTPEEDDDDDQATDQDESHEDGDEPKPRKKPKPKTLEDVATQLGVKRESLYAIEIPSSRAGEKPMTIGELKDLMAERDDFQVASIKLEEDRRAHEREKVAAEDEVKEILASLPAEKLTTEAREKIRKTIEARRAKNRAEILETIKEWKDPVKRESDLQAIATLLTENGIPGEFMLANMTAPVMRFLRNMQRLDANVRKALAAIEERKPKHKGPGSRREGGKKRDAGNGRDSRAGRLGGEVEAFRNAFSDRARH